MYLSQGIWDFFSLTDVAGPADILSGDMFALPDITDVAGPADILDTVIPGMSPSDIAAEVAREGIRGTQATQQLQAAIQSQRGVDIAAEIAREGIRGAAATAELIRRLQAAKGAEGITGALQRFIDTSGPETLVGGIPLKYVLIGGSLILLIAVAR